MNFDRIAPFYAAMERLTAGGRLHRCRIAFLDRIEPPQNILTIGEGHGRFLLACRRKFPDARIVVIDGSAKMLQVAEKLLKRHGVPIGRTEFVHSMLEDWSAPPAEFDLVVTHFVLDCLDPDQIRAAVSKISSAAKRNADWLIADFEIAPSGFAKWRSAAIIGLLYRFFRIVSGLKTKSLSAPDEALKQAGFVRIGRKTYEWGLLKSEWWQASERPID